MASLLTQENKVKIAANKKLLFELEGTVNHNKARAYLLRSKIAGNAALILKNQNSAFLGNRQLANENTDALFRNRIALLQTLPTTTEVEVNYREAVINKARLDFLEHRSQVNADVLAVAEDLASLNTQAIAISRRIMEANERVKEFNAARIAENTALIGASHNPTPESNAQLIAANGVKIAEITARAARNSDSMDHVADHAEQNKAAILKNAAEIAERCEAILKNHDAIAANRARIAEVVGRPR